MGWPPISIATCERTTRVKFDDSARDEMRHRVQRVGGACLRSLTELGAHSAGSHHAASGALQPEDRESHVARSRSGCSRRLPAIRSASGHSTGYRQTGTAPLDNAISHNGTDIEDFGLPENLMIAIAVLDTAGRFVTREVPSARRLSDRRVRGLSRACPRGPYRRPLRRRASQRSQRSCSASVHQGLA